MNVVIQVPLQAPVMKRELSSKMYSPSAYFLGRFLSNVIISLLYPLVLITMIYPFMGIETSLHNIAWFYCFGCVSNVVFCGQGYFLGIWIDDEINVKTVNSLFAMCWMAANGVLSNLTTANWFISGFAYISPFRYNCEAYVRIFTM